MKLRICALASAVLLLFCTLCGCAAVKIHIPFVSDLNSALSHILHGREEDNPQDNSSDSAVPFRVFLDGRNEEQADMQQDDALFKANAATNITDLSELTAWDWDSSAILADIAKAQAILDHGGSFDKLWSIYTRIMQEYNEYSDLSNLYDLTVSMNPSDEEAREAMNEFDRLDPFDEISVLIGNILTSGYDDVFISAAGNQRLWSLYGYTASTQQEDAAKDQQTQLQDRFDRLYYRVDDLTVDFQGEQWSWNRLSEDGNSLTDDEYLQLGTLLEENENRQLGQIIVDLINLRNIQARGWGYDNYYSLVWQSSYCRDYSIEEYQAMRQAIAEHMTKIYLALSEQSYDSSLYYYGDDYNWDIENFYAFAAQDQRLPEQLRTAFDVFQSSHVLFLAPDTGYDAGYMSKFFTKNLPFIYLYPLHSMYDLISVSHETGHALNGYICQDENAYEWSYFGSIDVCETQSSSTTLMLMDTLADFCPELGNEIREKALEYSVESLVCSAMDDEIERRLYENPGTLTLEKANEIATQVLLASGLSADSYFSDSYLRWVESEHLASYPCYTVSYVVSAAAALDIWLESQTDTDLAWDHYETVLAQPSSRVDFLEMTDLCCADDLFSADYYQRLAAHIRQEFLD